jgi:nucleoside phosphorylase
MGLASSAVLATKMILKFRPRLVAMLGVAAGARQGVQDFGDILAAEHTFDYGAGKITLVKGRPAFHPDPHPLQIGERLLTRLRAWKFRNATLGKIKHAWQGEKPKAELELHIGPLASGAAVAADGKTAAKITAHWRKLVGLEMEAYAVHRACNDTIVPAPDFLCLKSVCDFGGTDKSDAWQEYAAYTSASFFFAFIREEWSTLVPRNPSS